MRYSYQQLNKTIWLSFPVKGFRFYAVTDMKDKQTLKVVTVGQGQNLVLLHGWGLNSGVWDNLVPVLSPHFNMTLIDLPGFGLNHDIVPEDYDLSSVAKLIAEVIPSQSIVLGWSLGGLIAQYIAVNKLVAMKQLVLLCTSPKFKATEEWDGIAEPVLNLFHKQLEHDFGKTLERFLAIQAMGSQSAKSDIRQLKHAIDQYPLPHKNALSGGLKLLSEVDLRDQLSQISIPTTWFFGRLDSLVPQKVAGLINDLQPEAKQVVMSKVSHAPFVSDLESFSNILLNELHIPQTQ